MRLSPDSPMPTDTGKKVNLWFAFLLPAILVVLMTLSVWSDIRGFNEKAPFVEVRGEVAKLECGNHGQYQVSFSVGERVLTRGSGNLYLRANCKDLTAGQIVSVWYSAHDPSYASFVSPERALSYMKGEIASLVFFGYPFLAGFLFVAMKLRKAA
jgi:hypothetical protein